MPSPLDIDRLREKFPRSFKALVQLYPAAWDQMLRIIEATGQRRMFASLLHGTMASGIGTAAIQLMSARGHRVFTTAGSPGKCAACTALGYRQMIAVIGDSNQAASIGVHRACGFSDAGNLRNIGWKFGRWLDTPLMQLILDEQGRQELNRLWNEFDFLADFFAANADYNGSGGTDSSDFFDFLGCFFGGC